jgi:PDZ domain-containing secreted protein
VLPVGRLTQKMAGAAGHACDLFLYPAANSAEQVPDNLEMFPISSLEDA